MIEFESVTTGYKRSKGPVLEEFSWRVDSGLTVLLGPNGAGKTTLLTLGADARSPWHGRVSVDGLAPSDNRKRYRSQVGWMPQQSSAVPGLTCREQVAYFGWLKGLTRSDAWTGSIKALERVNMGDLGSKKTTEISGGQLRRIALAQTLIANPPVLLLDEPTAGLDPAQRVRFREILADTASDAKRTVIVSTHQIDDLDQLFNRVAIIDQGELRFEGSVTEFLQGEGNDGRGARAAEAAYARLVTHEG